MILSLPYRKATVSHLPTSNITPVQVCPLSHLPTSNFTPVWSSRHSLGMREADSRVVEHPVLTPRNPQAYTDPRAFFPLLRLLPKTSQIFLHTLLHRYKKSKQVKYYIDKHMHNESMTFPSLSPPPLRITVSLCIIDGFYFSVSFGGGCL